MDKNSLPDGLVEREGADCEQDDDRVRFVEEVHGDIVHHTVVHLQSAIVYVFSHDRHLDRIPNWINRPFAFFFRNNSVLKPS